MASAGNENKEEDHIDIRLLRTSKTQTLDNTFMNLFRFFLQIVLYPN